MKMLPRPENEVELVEMWYASLNEGYILHKLPLKAGYVITHEEGYEPVALTFDDFQEHIEEAKAWLLNEWWEILK